MKRGSARREPAPKKQQIEIKFKKERVPAFGSLEFEYRELQAKARRLTSEGRWQEAADADGRADAMKLRVFEEMERKRRRSQ